MALGIGGPNRRPASSGALRGLQSVGGGGVGMPGVGAPQAQAASAWNQNVQGRMQPSLNAMGGMTYATGTLNPMGQNRDGRKFYGWGADGPNYNPTVNYVQYGPGEGPNTPIPRAPGGGGGGTGPAPQEMGGLIGPMPELDRIPEIGPIEDSDAVRAAYGRAKDTAGQQGRAAMNALMEVQGARGIVGSGLGVNEAGGIISEGARQLGDFNREQAIQRVDNERWRQGTNYQGRINQRGQNLGQRGQELERRRYNAGNSPRGTVVY